MWVAASGPGVFRSHVQLPASCPVIGCRDTVSLALSAERSDLQVGVPLQVGTWARFPKIPNLQGLPRPPRPINSIPLPAQWGISGLG